MGFVQLMRWLHIPPRSHLHHPQQLHHHLLRQCHHPLHQHHLHQRHHRHLPLLHQVTVETSPIVQVMRHAVASLNSWTTASSMVAVNIRMRFAAPELTTVAQVIIPFVMLKMVSASRYGNSVIVSFQYLLGV